MLRITTDRGLPFKIHIKNLRKKNKSKNGGFIKVILVLGFLRHISTSDINFEAPYLDMINYK